MNTTFSKVDSNNKWSKKRFNPDCVAVLNEILLATDAEIICASDWRNEHTLAEMREMYKTWGVIKGPIGFTPRSKTYTGINLDSGRADEIKMWIVNHAWKDDTKWVAVDDLNMEEFLFPNFVKCGNDRKGMSEEGIKEKILNRLK